MRIVSGIHKNRILQSPKGIKTRPTSGRLREALFNICQYEIEGAHFLDLFAGSGAMGLEAISRGAIHATFVDNSRESISCIQSNVTSFKEENHTKVIYGDVFTVLKRLAKEGRSYEIIYADPPYETAKKTDEKGLYHSERVLNEIDALLGDNCKILAPGGQLFLEDAVTVVPASTPKHLILKNVRKMGPAALHYYIHEI